MSGPEVLIGGRYRLVEQIAAGGMGTVWEAWDERLHRRVALKQLHPQPGLSAADARLANDRAMREARITARLHHANAVPVYDVVDHDGMPCLIMQFLPSRSLQSVLAARGTLSIAEVARIGGEVAAALAAAHEVGIVHRDVKPGNVLIDADGSAKLTDFGISHAYGDITLTSTGMVSGTPAYLAPEVARGIESGFASDVFSLGATLYAAVEGAPPFGPGENPMAVLHRVASGRMDPPRRSGRLTPVLLDMLATDPARRPSMAETARALVAVHAAETDPAASATTQRLAARAPETPGPVMRGGPATPGGPVTRGGPGAGGNPVTANLPPVRVPPPSGTAPPRNSHLARNATVGLLVLLVLGVAILVLTQVGGGSDRADNAGPTTATSPASGPTPVASRGGSSPASRTASTSNTSASASASATPSSSTSTSTSPAAGTEDQIRAVDDYYAQLPGDTGAAWGRLTAGYQAQTGGRSNYDSFWNSFRSIEVSNERTQGGLVLVDLRYTSTKGAVSTETRSFRLVREDGTLKIAGSGVVGG